MNWALATPPPWDEAALRAATSALALACVRTACYVMRSWRCCVLWGAAVTRSTYKGVHACAPKPFFGRPKGLGTHPDGRTLEEHAARKAAALAASVLGMRQLHRARPSLVRLACAYARYPTSSWLLSLHFHVPMLQHVRAQVLVHWCGATTL